MTVSDEAMRRCILCGRELDETTVRVHPECVGDVRRDVHDIVTLYALLPAEIADRAGAASPMDPSGIRSDEQPLPGGDALVLLAGGSTTTTAAASGNRDHAADNLPTDVPSVLAVFGTWEDDWRSVLGITAAAAPATVTGCAVFLLRGLGYMAQRHDAFDEFADDMRRLRGDLELVLREDVPRDRAAIDCPEPDCGRPLRKHYRDPRPCKPGCEHIGDGHDQGGRRDEWVCRAGHRVSDASYWLAVRSAWEDEQQRRKEELA